VSRSAWLLALIVAAASIVPFWTCAVVPTQDGPAHLYNAWLLVHFDDPALQAARYFRINLFVPNWGGVGPLVPLVRVASPAVAEKILFSLIALTVVMGSAALAARLGGDPVLAAAAAVPVAHGWLVAMGFTGFALGLGLGLLLCAWAVGRGPREPPPSETRTALLLTVGFVFLFFVHLAAAVLAAAITALLIATANPGKPRRWAALGLPFAALVLLLGAWAIESRGRPRPSYRDDPRGALGRLLELPTGAYWQSFAVEDRRLGVAVVVLVAGLVLARATSGLRAPLAARSLLVASAVVLVAYALVPFAASGGAFLTDRLVPLLLLLPLPWATSEGLPRRRELRAAALLLAVAVLAHRGAQYRRWGRVVEGLAALNRGHAPGTLLVQPPWTDALLEGVDPLLHLWGRVAMETRAIPLDDYEAALVGLFPVSYTEEARALASAWMERRQAPAGAAVVRVR
jgi:hypothetical protein